MPTPKPTPKLETLPKSSSENFRPENYITLPHPYCITSKHIEHSNGILDEASIARAEKLGASCGVPDCILPEAAHVESALSIACYADPELPEDSAEFHAYLQTLAELFDSTLIENFGFIRKFD